MCSRGVLKQPLKDSLSHNKNSTKKPLVSSYWDHEMGPNFVGESNNAKIYGNILRDFPVNVHCLGW